MRKIDADVISVSRGLGAIVLAFIESTRVETSSLYDRAGIPAFRAVLKRTRMQPCVVVVDIRIANSS